MTAIENRIAKLEQTARVSVDKRTKGERDAASAAYVEQLLLVAAICNSPDELAAHIKSLEPRTDGQIVSIDTRTRENAMRASFARMVWGKAHGCE
jgi:hypothetical protein